MTKGLALTQNQPCWFVLNMQVKRDIVIHLAADKQLARE